MNSIEESMELSLLEKQRTMFQNNKELSFSSKIWWENLGALDKHITATSLFPTIPHNMLTDGQIEELYLAQKSLEDNAEYNPLFDSEHDKRKNKPCNKS